MGKSEMTAAEIQEFDDESFRLSAFALRGGTDSKC